MNEIQFRQATLEDLPTLLRFEKDLIKVERPFDVTLKDGSINYYDIEEMITSSDIELIVGAVKEEIVCSAYIKILQAKAFLKHNKFAHLGFMYVKPEFRRKGIIQLMIEEIKRIAKMKHIDELQLSVYNDNLIAIAAYEKSGFNKHLITMRIKI